MDVSTHPYIEREPTAEDWAEFTDDEAELHAWRLFVLRGGHYYLNGRQWRPAFVRSDLNYQHARKL